VFNTHTKLLNSSRYGPRKKEKRGMDVLGEETAVACPAANLRPPTWQPGFDFLF